MNCIDIHISLQTLSNPNPLHETPIGTMTSTEQPQFANAFGAEAPEMMRPRTGSRDYSNTAEWGE